MIEAEEFERHVESAGLNCACSCELNRVELNRTLRRVAGSVVFVLAVVKEVSLPLWWVAKILAM